MKPSACRWAPVTAVVIGILMFAACGKREQAESGRDGNILTTPFHQANRVSDLALTQSIREALFADDSLSMRAKNIQISTIDGRVTLRGPVETETERAMIIAKARGIAGDDRVIDQLEVKSGG